MNEEYLWNKTGEDPEIERLENALQAFRYQETPPPIVAAAHVENSAAENSSVTVLPFRQRRTARRFLPLAAAACIAFILLGAGVLPRQTSNDEISVSSETTQPQTSKTPEIAETNTPPTRSENAISDLPLIVTKTSRPTEKTAKAVKIKETVNRKLPVKQRFASIFKIVPAPSNKTETIARNESVGHKPESRNAPLSLEEQQAYSRLMLALSITNSKLQLVNDKIAEVGEQTAVVKDAR